LKVWISYAEFEASAGLGSEDSESEEKKHEVGYQEQQMERVSKCRGNDELENNSTLSDRIFFAFIINPLQSKITPLCFDDQLSLKGHLTTSEPVPRN
jgi:hypothetical protein